MSASHNPEHGSGSVRPHPQSMQQGDADGEVAPIAVIRLPRAKYIAPQLREFRWSTPAWPVYHLGTLRCLRSDARDLLDQLENRRFHCHALGDHRGYWLEVKRVLGSLVDRIAHQNPRPVRLV